MGDEEEGSYEFGWKLWGRSQEGGLQNGLTDYETYPRAARRGIFDVTYNVGISVPLGSNTKWKAFLTAVKARKWEEAAKECNKNRLDRGDEQRTVWREGLFQYAARIDRKKPAT